MAINDPGFAADGIAPRAARGPTARNRALIVVGIILIIGVIAGLSNLLPAGHKRPATTQTSATGFGRPFIEQAEPKPVVAAAAPAPHPTLAASPSVPRIFTPGADNALQAKMFSEQGSADNGPKAGAAVGPGQNDEKDDEFSAALTASNMGGPATAHRMRHPETTIPAFTVIPCTLDTAINSELVGLVRCHLASAVMNAEGTAAMLDKGAEVGGQIRAGLTNGQTRLFILWTKARNKTDNVTIDLASPAADELGINGVPGGINTHFKEMFFKSFLFSIIEYGPQLAVAALQNQNHGNTSFNNYTTFLTPQQSMANTILQQQLRIPPTLEKNQGDIVSIFVARELHFDKVYGFQRVAGAPPSTCEGCTPGRWTTQQSLERNNSQ